MAKICRDLDGGSHGGIVGSTATKTYAEGKLICLDGAVASCGATISASTTKTFAE